MLGSHGGENEVSLALLCGQLTGVHGSVVLTFATGIQRVKSQESRGEEGEEGKPDSGLQLTT